jgi:hypothetical protein
MNARKARMSQFGEKNKANKKKLERELLCHLPNNSN